MKKLVLIVCSFVFILPLVVNTLVYAGGEAEDNYSTGMLDASKISYTNSPMNKLGRGLINTVTCWTEVPSQVTKVSQESNPALGCTIGLAEGVTATLVRCLTGLFDVITFALPPYNKPILKPEYALKEADSNIKEYLW